MLYRPTPFFNTYTVSIISIFLRPNRILTVELHRSFFFIYPFFQEKTLGDISFKLETKIMNFMSGFFLKKIINQNNSSVVNKGNNKITELRTILQRESQNS
jgi:hypothetical protein